MNEREDLRKVKVETEVKNGRKTYPERKYYKEILRIIKGGKT